jgi:hypothetical protein
MAFKIAVGVVVGVLAVSLARGEDRPQWGERFTRNMVSAERGLVEVVEPSSGKGVKWRVPMGTQSYATAVVSGGGC